jgi:DNA helicase HerA-like ATPase
MADDVLRFAQVNFRRDRRVFGIKREDRFSHVYIIGKTGTGKSTLLETMALEDLALGNGFALIDPHGDLVERVASQVPQCRRGEVIYFNVPDPAQPYGYNPLRNVRADPSHSPPPVFSKPLKSSGRKRGASEWSTSCAMS